jgi:hypothetical protein
VIERTVGPWAKIERAKEHIEQFSREWDWFLRDVEPYRVLSEEDPEMGDLVYRVEVDDEVPAMLKRSSLIIGDSIHNLRSALDLLACQIVEDNGGTVKRSTGFPISESREEFETSGLKKINGASEDSIKLLWKVRPYKRGNEALYCLHRLDIADKHRLLLTVGSAHPSIKVTYRRPGWSSRPITLRPRDRTFPLKNKAELYRVRRAFRQSAENQSEPEFVFEIAFGDGEIVKGEPVVPMLNQLVGAAEQVVEIFESLDDIPF